MFTLTADMEVDRRSLQTERRAPSMDRNCVLTLVPWLTASPVVSGISSAKACTVDLLLGVVKHEVPDVCAFL